MADTSETKKTAQILVVDDSPTQLEALRFLLEDAGFSVVARSNGEEGLAAARANAIDLVISDIVMPEMDGYALCKALRAEQALRHLPVILLTSLSDPRDVIQGLESGANNFICKPYDDRALLARVQTVLANQEIRKDGPSEMGISIFFAGHRYFITADRLQILDLLLSTYENAVTHNTELVRARDQLRILNEQLEARVAQRTTALAAEVVERQKSEQREQHVNRVLRAMRKVNQLIVRENDPHGLIQDACELLVQTRGYRGAWIALLRSDDQAHDVAGSGWGEAFGTFAEQVRSGLSAPCWAKARATELGIVSLDPDKNCNGCPLGADCAGAPAMVVSLMHGHRLMGFMGISMPPQLLIDQEESALVLEVAGDVAFALNTIEETARRREVEERFRVSFERKSIGKALTSCDGRFLRVNDALATLLGYRADEVEGRAFADFTHPDDLASSREALRVLLAGAESQRFEQRFLCKDGRVVWADANFAAVRDTKGQTQYFVAGVVDVDDRRRAEEKLRQSEERFRILFEEAADSILLLEITPEGIPVIRDANSATFRLLGYDRDELIGRPVSQIEVAPDGPKVIDERQGNVLSRTGAVFEARHRCRDGTVREFECSATEIRIGPTTFAIWVERDVTARKQAEAERAKLEEQLRASQKMEAIGSLAGGVAHDFNNLLCVILSYTGFALEGVAEGDPLKNDLLEVKKAGERAASLTRQLLAFSRKQVLQPEVLDLNQIAAGVEKMLRRVLGEDIEFVQVLAPELGAILADPGQIEQVLMNLVVNARDAMPEGGKLTIETANVELDEEYAASHVAVTPGAYVQLAVTDTGCGMGQQTKARLFEPFFTTKEKGKGTGLGLSTAYGIVKQSGGSIWVYSELGQGTTFKIFLPRQLSDATVTTIRRTMAPTRSTGTETILVVEDEQALLKVARRTLEAAGYAVLAAAGGDEALLTSAAHSGDIHLLLTDVVMPRMSGRTLARELSKAHPMLKVLYMSGYTDDAIVHHGVLDAGTHFLSKPFTGAHLTRKVREVLDAGDTSLAGGHEQPAHAEAEGNDEPR